MWTVWTLGLGAGEHARCWALEQRAAGAAASPAAATAAATRSRLVVKPAMPSSLLQEFLKVFEQLRDEIVNDELLAGQPEASKQWVKEVGGG